MTLRATTRRTATVAAATVALALAGGPAFALDDPLSGLTVPLSPVTGVVTTALDPVVQVVLPTASTAPTASPAPAPTLPAPLQQVVDSVAEVLGVPSSDAPALPLPAVPAPVAAPLAPVTAPLTGPLTGPVTSPATAPLTTPATGPQAVVPRTTAQTT
ncbi:MAG: hypothetical protein JWN08_1816, partial [Frankiales bacterium]|nr:hypothetical protein [Frankiales bacterium]